jgi:transposase-like protein
VWHPLFGYREDAMNILEIMQRWPTHEAAVRHLEKVRWNGRPVCPYCESAKTCSHASKDHALPRWQCEDCHRAFTVTVGTIFHHTHLPLNKWFLALAVMLNAKKNVSNAQLARDLGLPYKTAWSLALRIRTAMITDPAQKSLFHGIVEMDEVYIGGKPRKGNGPKSAKPSKRGRGTKKLPVVGIVERHGRVITKAFDGVRLTQKHLNSILSSPR